MLGSSKPTLEHGLTRNVEQWRLVLGSSRPFLEHGLARNVEQWRHVRLVQAYPRAWPARNVE